MQNIKHDVEIRKTYLHYLYRLPGIGFKIMLYFHTYYSEVIIENSIHLGCEIKSLKDVTSIISENKRTLEKDLSKLIEIGYVKKFGNIYSIGVRENGVNIPFYEMLNPPYYEKNEGWIEE